MAGKTASKIRFAKQSPSQTRRPAEGAEGRILFLASDPRGDIMKMTLATDGVEREPMRRALRKIWRAQSGASAIEYGLLLAFIAVVLMVAAKLMSTNISDNFEAVAAEIDKTAA